MATSKDTGDQAMVITPYTPTIGAEISGINLRDPIPDDTMHAIRQALFDYKVIFFRDQDINDVNPHESKELLNLLYSQACIPEYQCRFKWQVNSIAFWDNRACQHYAVSDYWPARRVVERVSICGDKPV